MSEYERGWESGFGSGRDAGRDSRDEEVQELREKIEQLQAEVMGQFDQNVGVVKQRNEANREIERLNIQLHWAREALEKEWGFVPPELIKSSFYESK